MRRDGIVPPFATGDALNPAGIAPKRKADPADGFLAGLSQLAILTQNPDEHDHP